MSNTIFSTRTAILILLLSLIYMVISVKSYIVLLHFGELAFTTLTYN